MNVVLWWALSVVEMPQHRHKRKESHHMSWSFCPECATRIRVPRSVRRGDQIECPECATLLELIGIRPVELDVAAADSSGLSERWDWDEDEAEDDSADGVNDEDQDTYEFELDDPPEDEEDDLNDDEDDDDLDSLFVDEEDDFLE
jgi:hypothetical protein